MGVGLSLALAILYWFATNKLWYGIQHFTRQPLILALPIGLIMGNVPDAMRIGAALQLIYLGAIAPGGTLPSDEALAACIAIPLALYADLSPELAIPIAMPLGLLGLFIDNIKRTYHSYFVHQSDKAAIELDTKAMARNEFWYPLIVSIPLRIIPVFLGLFFGVDAIQAFLNALPIWALNGLTVAGGLLPALGFAVTIMVIGRKSLLPYFILGFTVAAYTGMNMITLAVLAGCIAVIQAQFANADSYTASQKEDSFDGDLEDKISEEGDF